MAQPAERDFKERSRTVFDRQARSYDTAGYGQHARRLQPVILENIEPLRFSTVLDVGCGTGALLDAIAAAHPDTRLLGIDLSPGMIAVARGRLGARAELHVADAEHLPFTDGEADLVVCVDSFHHYPNPSAALDELLRLTAPGGTLVMGEWHVGRLMRRLMNWLLPHMPSGDVRIYTPPELAGMVADAGYEVLRSEPAAVRGQLLVARRPSRLLPSGASA